MSALVNGMMRHVQGALAQIAQPRMGVVVSVDPNSARVKVSLQPDSDLAGSTIQTGWIPMQFPAIGWVWMPNVGDQVQVIPDNGDWDNWVCIGTIYSNSQMPPAAPANECWMVHVSGSALKLQSSGAVTIEASGGLTINGNVTVNGTVTATGDVKAGSISLENHVHSGVQGGSSLTGAPQG